MLRKIERQIYPVFNASSTHQLAKCAARLGEGALAYDLMDQVESLAVQEGNKPLADRASAFLYGEVLKI